MQSAVVESDAVFMVVLVEDLFLVDVMVLMSDERVVEAAHGVQFGGLGLGLLVDVDELLESLSTSEVALLHLLSDFI